MEGKEILFEKKSEKKNNGQIINDSYNNITDKQVTSTLNALNEYRKAILFSYSINIFLNSIFFLFTSEKIIYF